MARLTNPDLDNLLTSDPFYADPYPVYCRLRNEAPVFWSEAWGGWVLTRYNDVLAVLRDPARFSSAGRVDYLLDGLPENLQERAQTVRDHYRNGLAHSDPPDHTRLRALISRAFTPSIIQEQRKTVECLTWRLLNNVSDQPQFDILETLAYPLPATVIARMIGAPEDEINQFRRWAVGINRLFEGGGRTSLEGMEAARACLLELRRYISELAEQRRVEPRNDLITRLVQAEKADGQDADPAGHLSPAELVATAVTLFVAGHETTTHQLSNGLAALLRHPEQLAALRRRPEWIDEAVEELLRFDPPVQRGWRIARQPVIIGGQAIQPGDLVLPMLGAANHDPAAFPDPDKLDIRRSMENRHFSFGYGIHFCLGAPLARLELAAALRELLRRYPRLRLASEPLRWRHDVALRGVEELIVSDGHPRTVERSYTVVEFHPHPTGSVHATD